MIGRSIEKHNICISYHHSGNHTPNPLPSRQDINFFVNIFSGEKHFPKKSPEVQLTGIFGILSKPVNNCNIFLKKLFILQRKVCFNNGLAPYESSMLRFSMPFKYFKQGGHCT